MSQKEKFKCLRCGKCCRLRVKLSKEDIKRIEKKGHTNFIDEDAGNNKCMKMINLYCIFLTVDTGIASCKIYKQRPEICRKYPFFKNKTMTDCPFISKTFKS